MGCRTANTYWFRVQEAEPVLHVRTNHKEFHDRFAEMPVAADSG